MEKKFKFNWRKFFSYGGERMSEGSSEEQRYQAYKSRLLEEIRNERRKQQQKLLNGEQVAEVEEGLEHWGIK